jgi:hypothetical protein
MPEEAQMSALIEHPVQYVSAVETAKAMRQALKTAFPGVKFSVRKSNGHAIYVQWTDGPRVAAVQAIIGRFEGQSFDGMQDMRIERDPELSIDADGNVFQLSYCGGLTIESRSYSDEARAWATSEYERAFGKSVDDVSGGYPYGTDYVHRLLYSHDASEFFVTVTTDGWNRHR